jgi:hypothetical protein
MAGRQGKAADGAAPAPSDERRSVEAHFGSIFCERPVLVGSRECGRSQPYSCSALLHPASEAETAASDECS